MLSRSSLETQKLELMSAMSELKLQQAALERENLELRSSQLNNNMSVPPRRPPVPARSLTGATALLGSHGSLQPQQQQHQSSACASQSGTNGTPKVSSAERGAYTMSAGTSHIYIPVLFTDRHRPQRIAVRSICTTAACRDRPFPRPCTSSPTALRSAIRA